MIPRGNVAYTDPARIFLMIGVSSQKENFGFQWNTFQHWKLQSSNYD